MPTLPNNSGMRNYPETGWRRSIWSVRCGVIAVMLLPAISCMVAQNTERSTPAPDVEALRKMTTEALQERARALTGTKNFQDAITTRRVLLERRPELRDERRNLATLLLVTGS